MPESENHKEAPSLELEAVIERILDEKMKGYIAQIVKEIVERIQPAKHEENPLAI